MKEENEVTVSNDKNSSAGTSKPETEAPKPSVPETEPPHQHKWVQGRYNIESKRTL